jgi:hypothetical protein
MCCDILLLVIFELRLPSSAQNARKICEKKEDARLVGSSKFNQQYVEVSGFVFECPLRFEE